MAQSVAGWRRRFTRRHGLAGRSTQSGVSCRCAGHWRFPADRFRDPSPGQPPSAANAVRVYTVKDATSAPNESAITPYQVATCGSSSAHYRPAAYEAASATASGRRVVITGGSATQVAGCNDCETASDTSLLCTLTQSSLYDATSRSLSRLPAMAVAIWSSADTFARRRHLGDRWIDQENGANH